MFVGIIIVCFGILYLLEALYPGFHVDYSLIWPIVLIVIAIYQMIKEKKIDLFMSILLFVGIWFLLINTNILKDQYTDIFWPIIVILVGLSFIFSTIHFKEKTKVVNVDQKGIVNYHGIFGGVEERVKSKDFQGANIYSIFGGVDLDLRDITLKQEAIVINAYSIFGGATLLLPEDYNIILNSSAILGANENKVKNDFVEGRKTIYINCISIFGGTELK